MLFNENECKTFTFVILKTMLLQVFLNWRLVYSNSIAFLLDLVIDANYKPIYPIYILYKTVQLQSTGLQKTSHDKYCTKYLRLSH